MSAGRFLDALDCLKFLIKFLQMQLEIGRLRKVMPPTSFIRGFLDVPSQNLSRMVAAAGFFRMSFTLLSRENAMRGTSSFFDALLLF